MLGVYDCCAPMIYDYCAPMNYVTIEGYGQRDSSVL